MTDQEDTKEFRPENWDGDWANKADSQCRGSIRGNLKKQLNRNVPVTLPPPPWEKD